MNKKLNVTKWWSYEVGGDKYQIDAAVFDLPLPDKPWAGPAKVDPVTQVLYDTPTFRCMTWHSKGGQDYLLLAVPTTSTPWGYKTRRLDVTDLPPEVRHAFADEARKVVEQSLRDAHL
jgi:hypothetical protein